MKFWETTGKKTAKWIVLEKIFRKHLRSSLQKFYKMMYAYKPILNKKNIYIDTCGENFRKIRVKFGEMLKNFWDVWGNSAEGI